MIKFNCIKLKASRTKIDGITKKYRSREWGQDPGTGSVWFISKSKWTYSNGLRTEDYYIVVVLTLLTGWYIFKDSFVVIISTHNLLIPNQIIMLHTRE